MIICKLPDMRFPVDFNYSTHAELFRRFHSDDSAAIIESDLRYDLSIFIAFGLDHVTDRSDSATRIKKRYSGEVRTARDVHTAP
jgi:hypothetical protein